MILPNSGAAKKNWWLLYHTISAHVLKRALQFAIEKLQYTGMTFKSEKYSECFYFFGAIFKATNNSTSGPWAVRNPR